MKLRHVLAALALTVSATAQAALIEAPEGGDPAKPLPLWSTVCLGNIELEGEVAMEFRYGEGEWQHLTIAPEQMWIFRYRFAEGSQPAPLQVRFDADMSDEVEMREYALQGNITHLRPMTCRNAKNFEFKLSPARDNTIDLFPMEEN